MVSWVIGWLVVGTLAGIVGMFITSTREPVQRSLMLLFGPAGAVVGGFATRTLVASGAPALVGAVAGAVIGVPLGWVEIRRQPVA
ncbi:MAG: hypothetical protein M3N68_14375 [Actinomycetota bacterium]|nr:hypothetical protein [Actinomycetota bacterium]